jgi:hypothetical protein
MRKLFALALMGLFALPPAFLFGQSGDGVRLEIVSVTANAFPLLSVTANVYDSLDQPLRGLGDENFSVAGELSSRAQIIRVENVTDDRIPFATVLAIDVSSSMSGIPLERAKAAARAYIDSLRPDDPVAIVVFGSLAQVVREFTTDRGVLATAIESLEPVGQTALYQGAYEAVRLAASAPVERRAVILLGDGVEYGGRSAVSREAALERAIADSVPVYTIGLGYGADRTYLQSLSAGTNARYYESPTPDELVRIYNDLATLLRSQYILTVNTGLPGDGTTYTLGLRVATAQSSATADFAFRAPIPIPIVRLTGAPTQPVAQLASFTIEVLADDPLASVTVDDGLSGERILVDFLSPYAISIDPLLLPPGARLYVVTATDSNGDRAAASIAVEIAALPADIVFTNLEPGEMLNANRTIGVTFITQTPVMQAAYFIDGIEYGRRASTPWDITVDVLALGPGEHTLQVVADNSGGKSATEAISFRVGEAVGLTQTALAPTATPSPTATASPTATHTSTATPDLPATAAEAARLAQATGAALATSAAQSAATQSAILAALSDQATQAQATVVRLATQDAEVVATRQAQIAATEAQLVTVQAAQAAAFDALATRDMRATANALATQTAIPQTQAAQATIAGAIAATDSAATQAAVLTATGAAATQAAALTATDSAATQQAAALTATGAAATQVVVSATAQAIQAATATALALEIQAIQTAAAEQSTLNAQATAITLATDLAVRADTATARAAQIANATATVQTALNQVATANALATAIDLATALAVTANAATSAAQQAAAATANAQATIDTAATAAAHASLTMIAATGQTAATEAASTMIAQASLTVEAQAVAQVATSAARATETVAAELTRFASPTLTPSATPELVEVAAESPPAPSDLLPLACVVGAAAGALALVFILLGGRRNRRINRRGRS